MAKRRKSGSTRPAEKTAPTSLRIIGGKYRGRLLQYHGDRRTRPMKDRVREAVFNLLGPAIKKKYVLDLFAGTGAIGFEALSRGADSATFIERHFPSVKIIDQNAHTIGVDHQVQTFGSDSFLWLKQNLAQFQNRPLAVFISPPYSLFLERPTDILQAISKLWDVAAPDSLFIVESDNRFDKSLFPHPDLWDHREYAPAVVSIAQRNETPMETFND